MTTTKIKMMIPKYKSQRTYPIPQTKAKITQETIKTREQMISALEDKVPYLVYDDSLEIIDIIFIYKDDFEQLNEHNNYLELTESLRRQLLKAVEKIK